MTSLNVGRLFEAEESQHAVDDARLRALNRCRFASEYRGTVHRSNDADAQPPCRNRQLFLFIPPHENSARLRVDDNVEAILGSIIDDDVEVQ